MGIGASAPAPPGDQSEHVRTDRSSRILFFLHRTWTVIVAEKWSRTRVTRQNASESVSDYGSQYSQYTFCSCSQCQRDDGFSSGCDSELFGSGSSMAPNSEESMRIGQFSFPDDTINKEKQRPPIYNPEDYALSLKKWGKKPPNGGTISLYPIPTSSDTQECISRSQSNSFRDYRNPMLISSGSEMTLRQFGTVTELLAKLKSDLRLAYPSFVQEFVGDPLDGVTLLLDLLRAIQLSQSTSNHATSGSNNATGKIPPALQRRALLDELSCLQCLLLCCQRYSESVRKLTSSSAGLFTLAICIMSNVTKSRILALQLLTKACQPPNDGHSPVSEAMSTLRLRFGEPVRFRFLVGMLMSTGGQGELLAAGMKFLNTFLDTAGSAQKRLYVQAELEQAGFDIATIKKSIGISSTSADQIFEEMDHWEKKHLDVECLTIRLESAERENDSLRDKVLLLERRVQILLEEKGILISLEQCLKERCSELQEEVLSLKSEKSQKNSSCGSSKKKANSPHEDEGISSSERSLTPEDDIQRDSSVYEMFSLQSDTLQMKKSTKKIDDDEETTIDEVIEELRNIINDAETETYRNEELQRKKEERKRMEEAQVASKIQMRVAVDDYMLDPETEIVPSNLHPQPPRRTRSLVHLFIPAEDYDYGNKELFFENETAFTSEDGSDSLLSASKYQLPRLEKDHEKKQKKSCASTARITSIKRSESFRHLTNQNPSVTVTVVPTQTQDHHKKSKSLDRIDDGLDSMVDIVVTDHKLENRAYQPRTKSDSGNVTGGSTSLSRSMSNVFASVAYQHQRKGSCNKLLATEDQKMKMFLPSKRDSSDVPYYFPRVQEKKSNSFLIKRGHTNAGLYSGQIVGSRESYGAAKTKEFSMPIINGCRVSGKVTDLPSGLY